MQIRQLSYRSDVTSAVIGEGITDMGELWMSGYTSLVSVSFPDTITLLKNVCCNCPELTSVRFPAKLESLVGRFHGVQKPDDDRAAGHTEVHFGQLCWL